MTRRKPPAEDRTIDLFTGKTKTEEAEDLVREEEFFEERPDGPRDLKAEAMIGAESWTKLDGVNPDHAGDDLRLLVSSKGHAIMVLSNTTKRGEVYGTRTILISKKQFDKLRKLVENVSKIDLGNIGKTIEVDEGFPES